MDAPTLHGTEHHEYAWSFIIENIESTPDMLLVLCERLGFPKSDQRIIQPFAKGAYPYATVRSPQRTIHLFVQPCYILLSIEGDTSQVFETVRQLCRRNEERDPAIPLNIDELRKELIELYARYIEDTEDTEMRDHAQTIGNTYKSADDILPADINEALGPLINIGVALDPRPTPQRAKEILTKLQEPVGER